MWFLWTWAQGLEAEDTCQKMCVCVVDVLQADSPEDMHSWIEGIGAAVQALKCHPRVSHFLSVPQRQLKDKLSLNGEHNVSRFLKCCWVGHSWMLYLLISGGFMFKAPHYTNYMTISLNPWVYILKDQYYQLWRVLNILWHCRQIEQKWVSSHTS